MNKTKQNYHHGSLRETLLAAGEEVLTEKGFRGFTLRACARRAGVSHAAPKHHFGDTKGFLTELAAVGFDRLRKHLLDGLSGAEGLDAEFLAITHAYSTFTEHYPEHFRIMFRGDLLDLASGRLKLAARKTLTELTNVILRQRGEAEVVVDEIDQKIHTEDVMSDIVIGWCYVHGYAHLMLEKQFPVLSKVQEDRILKDASERISHLIQLKKNRR